MIRVHCTVCNEETNVATRFEVDGECPECGAEAGSLVTEDAYDERVRQLRCVECGWEVEADVQIEIGDDVRTFTVDDNCAICEQAGVRDNVLAPADSVSVRAQPEYAVARGAAQKLRARTVGNDIPVAVEAIAPRLGLTIERGYFDHDGMLNGTTIEVPTGHAGPERFVIAHEIGHHELRHDGSREKIEPEANAFASELIIPRARLRVEITSMPYLTQLAGRFEVSRQAIFYAVSSARLTSKLLG